LNLKTIQTHDLKPYCATHVPKVSHTQVASVEMKNAMSAPKAARAVKGVNMTARATFAPGALNPTSGADVVNKGGVAGSDVQSAHAPRQTYQAPEPTPSISYDASEQFSNMSVSGGSSAGYDQGYDQGYDEGGYDEGYDQGGYEQGGYEEGGYDEGGYDEGYAEEGYAEEGYYEEGYDEGYYEEGYEEEGYY